MQLRYWGKRDASLNLPTNSSHSVTLAQSDLRAHTTASCSSTHPPGDTLILNNTSEPIPTSSRTSTCLTALRSLRRQIEASDASLPPLSTYPLHLVSSNNFPTAAGLASSAAGFAALVRAVADLYNLPQSPEELSIIARQGSGSACRSLLGGYVSWEMGSQADGSDSLAYQVAPASHWPEMRALILVVSAAKKSVSSTAGMQKTVQTSALFPVRAHTIVPQRMKQMETAIQARDFATFASLTMRDSNSFHACCLDTDPPIFYLNDVSRAAIRAVEDINTSAGRALAAYTFDAGPNCVIYYLDENRDQIETAFREILPHVDGWSTPAPETSAPSPAIDARAQAVLSEGVCRVIRTRVGEGPQPTNEHLIDEAGNVIHVDDA